MLPISIWIKISIHFLTIMLVDYLVTILWSISPLGEARVGIPYGVAQGIPIPIAFVIGLGSNLLVFPVFYNLITFFNKKFWSSRKYRQHAVNMTRRAKKGTEKVVKKYGFIGLMIFVMIPLPFTGAYMGTISAHLFRFDQKKALLAVSLGVTISCVIIFIALFLGDKAIN